jgi:23S rRNA pseudouridine1911/1915/1917 synthase
MLLIEYLIQKLPSVKRTTFKRMLESRRIVVNGKPAIKLKQEITPEDKIQVLDAPLQRPPRKSLPAPADDRPGKPIPSPARTGVNARLRRSESAPTKKPHILYEDDDLLVLVKPAGLLTSTTAREKRPTLANMLKNYLAENQPRANLGIIHRLDRDASGLLVFSKNPDAYDHLKNQFYHHTVDRIYTVVVEGLPTPKAGRIENFLYELPTGKVVTVVDQSKGQIARTDYETLAKLDIPKERRRQPPIELPLHHKPVEPWAHRSLLKVTLQTGRKHQIRAHLAARKTPIVGDRMYGPDPEPVSPLLLAATTLAFDHPATGERLTFTIDPPREIRALFPEYPFTPATEEHDVEDDDAGESDE